MGEARRKREVAVVGAGPVGCLAALSFGKLGFKVSVYENRPDIRLASSKAVLPRRSVNLAISSRGLAALEFVDPAIATRFLETAIPMPGRIVHPENGPAQFQAYDLNGQHINSIDRMLLNEGLLNELSAYGDISIHFHHKVVAADFDTRTLTINDSSSREGRQKTVKFDLCIGADGSFSHVRGQLMRVLPMDFQQTYIPHEYIELRMPPLASGSSDHAPRYRLDPHGLHIWPRHSLMLIALPNKDGSFTCTLFAPRTELARLRDRRSISSWFQDYFPEVLGHIGMDDIVKDLIDNPRSPLISIKANPYHYKDRVIILGDAAHSMVPFYGQGLNCGLEDVRILSSLIVSNGMEPTVSTEQTVDEEDPVLAAILEEYTQTRHADLVAICDLAMDNYIEMRHSVTTPTYRLRKAIDGWLSHVFPSQKTSMEELMQASRTNNTPRQVPSGWLSLYTMVTFRPDIPYAIAKEKSEWQRKILDQTGLMMGFGLLGLIGLWALRR